MWFTHTEAEGASSPVAASPGTDSIVNNDETRRHGPSSWITLLLTAVLGIAAVGVGAFAATPSTAEAHSPWVYRHNNRCPHFYSYQHGPGGLFTTAGVNFQPDDLCNGTHVKQAWVRVYQSGPAWRCQPHADSGKVYTGRSSNPHTERWHWAEATRADSVTPRCSIRAHYNYWGY